MYPLWVVVLGWLVCANAWAGQTLHVFAAASLSDVLGALVNRFQEAAPDARVRITLAGSSTLARQIEAGAPADLFISANTQWMDHLDKAQRIIAESRTTIAQNTLVLISHDAGPSIQLDGATPLPEELISSRIAVGLTDAVPAGQYAKQALTSLQQWDLLAPQLVETDNVRAALRLVALGEAGYGIVYATDAQAEARVFVRGTFPRDSHQPIEYPMALIDRGRPPTPLAVTFAEFVTSDVSASLLQQHGFSVGATP